MAEKNKIIKNNLHNLYQKLSEELTQTSFEQYLFNEIEQTSEIIYSHQDGLMTPEELRQKHINEINKLLSNKKLIDDLNSLPNSIHSIDKQKAKKHLSIGILEALKSAEAQCKNKQDDKWNMLFLVHNYDPEFWLGGIDDPTYEDIILDGSSYIKVDWTKWLFDRISFDFSICLKPFLAFKKRAGEDILFDIANTLFIDEHYYKIKDLYILNTYIILHEAFDEIRDTLLQLKIPMANKVHIFANEYDCEHFSIYELQTT